MHIGLHVKSCQTQRNLNFLDSFSKKPPTSNFKKIRTVGAELFHVDGQADMT